MSDETDAGSAHGNSGRSAGIARISLRVLAGLTLLHGALTLVAANFLPLSAIGNRLLFAQHGFAFVFLALLNLVMWQQPLRGATSRAALHVCNAAFLVFYLMLATQNPEPPNWVSAGLVGGLMLVGVVLEATHRSPKPVRAS